MQLPLSISPAVMGARHNNRPIVALESTIITHGMPWPDNLTMARKVEETVRAHGAEPATIAVMGGRIHIGLEPDQLTTLARTPNAMKLSRADLAHCLATKATGATTVAATMICAHLAGIEVFATGGIGGVHRGASESFDISADLEELARRPVNVVCAGAKAILDLPKTFERLETLGVPVMAYQSDEIPAFWSRNSGIPAPLRCDTVEIIARGFRLRQALGLEGGQLIANPIPLSAEIPFEEIMPHIEEALQEAAVQKIAAKAVTPYLLQQIFERTDGRSLTSNIALVLHNAALAAKLATALCNDYVQRNIFP